MSTSLSRSSATVVLSIDAELGWGFHDRRDPPVSRIQAARWGWHRLVELFEETSIPATWAVVGHLLLDSHDGGRPGPPSSETWSADERDRWRFRPRYRFGWDLVEAVRDADVPHEIGCHSFSHVIFGAESTTRALAREEIERALEAGWDRGLSFESFIYPRNDIGHRDLLAEYGFTCYRSLSPDAASSSRLRNRFRKLVRSTVPGYSPPVVEPVVDEHGLVAIPASLYLYGFEGHARTVAAAVAGDPVVRQARRGIDAVVEDGGVFHMWLHPNNLVGEREVERLRAVLEYLARRRDATELRVETMAALADRTLGVRDAAPPASR